MSFKQVRKEIVSCLQKGRVQHESRAGKIDEKNFLAVGKITIEDAIRLLSATNGRQYSCSSHHILPEIEVHIFKPVLQGTKWYLKCYLVEPDVWFISVHR